MRVIVTETGVKAVADGLLVSSLTAGARANAVTRHFGQLVLTQVKANASGRPGPRAITGDYRRSIGVRFGFQAGLMPWAEVGTNKAQARRLELGFVGKDSLRRHYDQPPYPHFGPAVDRYAGEYAAALVAGVMPPRLR